MCVTQASKSRLAVAMQLHNCACQGLPGATTQTVPSAPVPWHHCHTRKSTTKPPRHCATAACVTTRCWWRHFQAPCPRYPAGSMQHSLPLPARMLSLAETPTVLPSSV